jgi:hypothetical protein
MFAFRGPSSFDLFCSIVPPHHLASIRKLHIEVMYRETFICSASRARPQPDFQKVTEWTRFWESVGQLTGLTTLEVNVADAPAFWIYARADHKKQSKRTGGTNAMLTEDFGLLDLLRTMRQLDRVEVTLPQMCQVIPREDEPFQLTYLEDGMY